MRLARTEKVPPGRPVPARQVGGAYRGSPVTPWPRGGGGVSTQGEGWRSMDAENSGTAQGRGIGSSARRAAPPRGAWRARSRWLVHLGLLASFAGAFATLQLLHIHNAIHTDRGAGLRRTGRPPCASAATGLPDVRAAHACPPTGRDRTSPLGVGCDPHLRRDQRRCPGILDWGHGEPLLLPLPMPFQEMGPDLVGGARDVPGRPRHTPVEARPAVHRPIALRGVAGCRCACLRSLPGRSAAPIRSIRRTAPDGPLQ